MAIVLIKNNKVTGSWGVNSLAEAHDSIRVLRNGVGKTDFVDTKFVIESDGGTVLEVVK